MVRGIFTFSSAQRSDPSIAAILTSASASTCAAASGVVQTSEPGAGPVSQLLLSVPRESDMAASYRSSDLVFLWAAVFFRAFLLFFASLSLESVLLQLALELG